MEEENKVIEEVDALPVVTPKAGLYREMLVALFGKKKGITISELDEENNYFSIEVEDLAEYNLLRNLLVVRESFGDIKVNLTYSGKKPYEEYIASLLKDSGLFAKTFEKDGVNYLLFKDSPVKLKTDDPTNPWGVTSTMPEAIAKAIFRDGLNISTEVE